MQEIYMNPLGSKSWSGKMKGLLQVCCCLLIMLVVSAQVTAQKRATLLVNTAQGRKAISPFIYGTNDPYAHAGSKRIGGNRLTNYNWENNASNAGRDWYHESDNYVPWQQGVPDHLYDTAGEAISSFHRRSLQQNAYSLVTLPMAGYVARDKNGAISEAQAAPSSRWVPVEYRKPQHLLPFQLKPDTQDNAVYVDELLHYLMHNFGASTSSTGIRGYSLDNEPGLWFDTHSRLWGHTGVSVKYLMENSFKLAELIKEKDPHAEVFGPASWGITEFENLQFAPDWDAERGNYTTFIDLYLDRMRKRHDSTGQRLLDVLDVHWYPQGNNNGISPFNNGTDYETNRVRMEMTRSLWDATYIENTWVGNDPFKVEQFLPFIPKMHQHIDQYYPGTKLGITEYSYMGMGHASGGIAQADALGIFGRQGLYFANYWGTVIDYIKAGFDLFRNYDGKGGKFGNTSIFSETNDIVSTSVHASINEDNDSLVHVIAMNKSQDSAVTVTVQLQGSGRSYKSAKVWAFDNNSSTLKQLKSIRNIENNTFEYVIPPVTACHLVLSEEDLSGHPDIDELSINSPAGYSDGTASFEITAKVYDGNNDLKWVRADLSGVGGAADADMQPVAGEPGVYRIAFTVPAGVASGLKTIHVVAEDATEKTAFANLVYRVIAKVPAKVIWDGDSITRGVGNVFFDGADSIARGASITRLTNGGNEQPGSLYMHFVHELNRYNVMTWRISNNDNPADAVNIIDHGVLEFYIRSNAPAMADIEVSLRDASAQLHTSSSVALKRDGFIASFNKDRYTRVRIPLSKLTSGSEIKLDQVWQINFLSNNARDAFDVWIDDIRVLPFSHPVLQPVIDSATISPNSGYANGQTSVTIKALVQDPDNNLQDVTIDLSAIGGTGIQTMELVDGWYTTTATVATGLSKGDKQIWITATDADGNSVSSQVLFTVLEKATKEVIWDGDNYGSGAAVIVVDPSTIQRDSLAGNKGPIALKAYMHMGTVGFSSVHWDWNDGTGDTAMRDLSTKGYISFYIKSLSIKPGNDIQVFLKDRFGAFSESVPLIAGGYLAGFNGEYQQVRIPMQVLLSNRQMDARQVTRIGFLAFGLDAEGISFLVDDIIAGGSNVADVRIATNDAACGATGTIHVQGINNGGTLGYQFYLNDQPNPAGIGSPLFEQLAPGTYELRIDGPNDFQYVETIEIGGQLNNLSATIVRNGYALDLTVTGGSGQYTYAWSNGATTEDIAQATPGTHEVVVTDTVLGCTVRASVVIPVGEPGATLHVKDAECGPNGTITVSNVTGGVGPFQYYLNGVVNPAGAQIAVFAGLMPGNYEVEIRGEEGFVYTSTVTIGGNASVPVIASNISYQHGKAFIDLTVTGGSGYYTYQWTGGATTTNLWYVENGTYEVTVTDLQTNCTTKASFAIVNPAMQLEVVQPDCNTNASVRVTSTSGLTAPLNYFVNGRPNPAGISVNHFTGLSAGEVVISVMDAHGIEISEYVKIRDGYTKPVIAADITYENGKGFINLRVQGGSGIFGYKWNGGSTFANIWYAENGVYTVEVTDLASGCTATATFTLEVPELTLETRRPNCGEGGVINVKEVKGLSGTLNYYLNGEANPAGVQNPIFNGLAAGLYTIKVVNENDIATSQVVYIEEGVGAPEVSGTIRYENGRGYIDLHVRGGSGIYGYEWTGGSTFANLWDVAPGTYEVWVTDYFSMCRVKAVFTVQPVENNALLSGSRRKADDDASLKEQPLIYPNPVTNGSQVRIRFNFEKHGIRKILVRNQAGAIVAAMDVPAGTTHELKLVLPLLQKGVYNVTLTGKQQFTQRLLVLR